MKRVAALVCVLLVPHAWAGEVRVDLAPLASPISATPAAFASPAAVPALGLTVPSFASPAPLAAAALSAPAAVSPAAPLAAAADESPAPSPAANIPAAALAPAAPGADVARGAAIFDGALHPLLTGLSDDLSLEGLSYGKGLSLIRGGVPAETLGRGTRGVVHAHPAVPGAAIKTVAIVDSISPHAGRDFASVAAPTPAEMAAKEEKTARALAAVGAGPRYFGRAVLEGRQVSVRERVYGKTIDQLARAGAYGPDQHALVLATIRRLAEAGLSASDIRPENVMIGRTAADPKTRAYVVDGGAVLALSPERGPDERVQDILAQYVPTNAALGLGSTLGRELQKTLDRSASAASGGLWGRLARLVGIGRAPKPVPPPRDEAERLDREFGKIDFWAQVAPDARAEIEGLRARRLSKAALKAYVRREAAAAFSRIMDARGTANVGFHYNLHGGARESYVGAGIRASKGDIALRYTPSGDLNDKVYFFQTAAAAPYDALDASNGEILYFPSRMGYVLSMFAVDAPALESAKADGRIANAGSISMDFHKGMRGVPYSAFLAPPLPVFVGAAKKLGLRRLSRDEETLATARYLEAALTAGGAYVPGGTPASAEAVARGAAARALAAAAAAPLTRIEPHFPLSSEGSLYHGTTLDDLVAVLDSGGRLAPEVSQFSARARDSVQYASERRRRLGREDNPEVLLQFRREDLNSLVSGELFQAALAVSMDRGLPPTHAAYVAATKPVPLRLMTPESKETLLSWLRAQAARRPDEPKWAALAARFAAALDAR